MTPYAAVFAEALRVGWQDLRSFWTWQTWLTTWLVRTVSSAMLWVLLGRLLGEVQTAEFLLIGNAVLTGPSSVCWAIAAATWDRSDGTYPLLVVSPSSLVPAIAGRSFIWVLNGILTSWVIFAILGVGFDLSFPAKALYGLPLLVPVICLATFGYALFAGAFVARAPRIRIMINFGSTNVLMALTGVSVPVAFWPPSVRVLAELLPVTNGLRAVRLCFEDGAWLDIVELAGRELMTGCVWLALSVLTMDKLANAGRRDGSIDFTG